MMLEKGYEEGYYRAAAPMETEEKQKTVTADRSSPVRGKVYLELVWGKWVRGLCLL